MTLDEWKQLSQYERAKRAEEWRDAPFAFELAKSIGTNDFINHWQLFKDTPYFNALIEEHAKDSGTVLMRLQMQERFPREEAVPILARMKDVSLREENLRQSLEKDPLAVLFHYDSYKDKPYAEAIRSEAANPERIARLLEAGELKTFAHAKAAIGHPFEEAVITRHLKKYEFDYDDLYPLIKDRDYADQVTVDYALKRAFTQDATFYANMSPELRYKVFSALAQADKTYPITQNIASVLSLNDDAKEYEILKVALKGRSISSLTDSASALQDQPYFVDLLKNSLAHSPYGLTLRSNAEKAVGFLPLETARELARENAKLLPISFIDLKYDLSRGYGLDTPGGQAQAKFIDAALEGAFERLQQPGWQEMVKADPFKLLPAYSVYAHLPNASEIKDYAASRDVLVEAAKKSPRTALFAVTSYLDKPHAKEVIEAAIQSGGRRAGFAFFMQYEHFADKEWAPALMRQQIQLSPISYYRNAHNIPETLKEQFKEEAEAALGVMLDKQGDKAYLRLAQTLNALHDEPANVRFAAIDTAVFTPERLFELVVKGREEVYTSTFNGVLDRFVAKLKAEGRDLSNVIADPKLFDQLPVFLEAAASYGRIGEVFALIPEHQRSQVIERMMQKVGESSDLSHAVSTAELMNLIEDPAAVKAFEDGLIAAYEKAEAAGDVAQQDKFGLIASWYAQEHKGTIQNKAFFERVGSADRYSLPTLETVPKESLFDAQGRHTQVMTFFNDSDGATSFENHMKRYQASPDKWSIKDEGSYVVITAKGMPDGKSFTLYANKPVNDGSNTAHPDGIKAMQAAITATGARPQVYIHRGHSYHVDKTVGVLQPDAAMVFLGSCGGHQNIGKVLSIAPDAHIISTKGVGTKFVNDPLFYRINSRYITQGRDIPWDEVWRYVDGLGDKRKELYVNPSENMSTRFISTYNKLRKADAQPIRKGHNETLPVETDFAALGIEGQLQSVRLASAEEKQIPVPKVENDALAAQIV